MNDDIHLIFFFFTSDTAVTLSVSSFFFYFQKKFPNSLSTCCMSRCEDLLLAQ